MEYLDQSYKDANYTNCTTEELQKLKQKEGQYFAAFLPSFKQTLADAREGAWLDLAKLAFLKGTLNMQLF